MLKNYTWHEYAQDFFFLHAKKCKRMVLHIDMFNKEFPHAYLNMKLTSQVPQRVYVFHLEMLLMLVNSVILAISGCDTLRSLGI